MVALELLEEIVSKNNNIKKLTFHEYPEQVLLQDIVDDGVVEAKHFESALKIRADLKLPFWDCMMLTYFDCDSYSSKILRIATTHNKIHKEISTCDVAGIRRIVESNPSVCMAFNSKVEFEDGNVKHFCLLDFHIQPSNRNLIIVKEVLNVLGLSGYILDSGKSYHFIGHDYYTADEVITILAQSLFFAPIVDKSWIAHQLIERSCSLRVGYKHSMMPVFICEV